MVGLQSKHKEVAIDNQKKKIVKKMRKKNSWKRYISDTIQLYIRLDSLKFKFISNYLQKFLFKMQSFKIDLFKIWCSVSSEYKRQALLLRTQNGSVKHSIYFI